jgi:hypothetical protein
VLPQDIRIPPRELKKILSSENTVLLVDGFDEAHSDNPLLRDVIQQNLLSESTVVVASRSGYLADCHHHFNSLFTLQFLKEEQQKEMIENFAAQTKLSALRLSQLKAALTNEYRDLCRTPLMLTVLCIVFQSYKADEKLPRTRTQVYEKVHHVVVTKAAHRSKRSTKDIDQTTVAALAHVAFKMWREELNEVSEEDLESFQCSRDEALQLGYIVQEHDGESMRFCHRTFLEFLAALHFKKIVLEEQHGVLKTLHPASNASFLLFIFGTLNETQLIGLAPALLSKMQIGYNRAFFSRCPPSHLMLQCINQINEVTPALDAIIVSLFDPFINLTPSCSNSCIEGAKTICTLKTKTWRRLDIAFTLCTDHPGFASLMKVLAKCIFLGEIILFDFDNYDLVSKCIATMETGALDSWVRRLVLLQSSIRDIPPSSTLPIGNCMRAMWLECCSNAEVTNAFLSAAIENQNLAVV